MKHNAEQYELFPPTMPETGSIVRVIAWTGRKFAVSTSRWRVISWPLYFLLSGDDPEGWPTNDGHRKTPEPGTVPLLATSLDQVNAWGVKGHDFCPWSMCRSVPLSQVAQGY